MLLLRPTRLCFVRCGPEAPLGQRAEAEVEAGAKAGASTGRANGRITRWLLKWAVWENEGLKRGTKVVGEEV